MDALLSRLGVQAVNYAIRSGIALTSTYAISQCSRLLKTVDDKAFHAELKSLQKLLNNKIKIISPAIDLIEFKSGRGNIFLESAVPLAKSLHREIVSLGRRLENAAAVGEDSQQAEPKTAAKQISREHEIAQIITDIKSLLARIERDSPLLQLAITASGESLSTSLPQGVSPSRLLQASTFLIVGDTQYANDPSHAIQIGPAFTLSLYMLFLGHASPGQSSDASIQTGPLGKASDDSSPLPKPHGNQEYGFADGDRKPLWQEVIHKARVRLCRTSLDCRFDGNQGFVYKEPGPFPDNFSEKLAFLEFGRPDEYAYHLEIIEDLDDGRAHDQDEAKCQPYDNISRAGIRESIPIHQFSKIFYTDTGRILNIGNAIEGGNNPILLLKRDPKASAPSKPGVLEDSVLAGMIEDASSTHDSDEQAEIDRQLSQELEMQNTERREPPILQGISKRADSWAFPSHLDPEWLALEVFEDDVEDDESSSDTEDASFDDSEPELPASEPRLRTKRSSLDSRIISQIKNISLRSSPLARKSTYQVSSPLGSRASPDVQVATQQRQEDAFVARSPFGAIVSSLSLLEMLIRLTGLQESQQASHLSIPDHILTFFLEETSTTGFGNSNDRWKARTEAKRRVGFDPYTDTPR